MWKLFSIVWDFFTKKQSKEQAIVLRYFEERCAILEAHVTMLQNTVLDMEDEAKFQSELELSQWLRYEEQVKFLKAQIDEYFEEDDINIKLTDCFNVLKDSKSKL
jgi:hypothetical protein